MKALHDRIVFLSNPSGCELVDYIAESHGALQNQPDTLLNLLKRIQSAQTASLGDSQE